MDEQRRINWLIETEKLLINLNTLRNSAEKLSALKRELHSVNEESDFLHAEVQALKAKLNKTALEFGLAPME